ncbi:phosphoribosylglycinamide formyltransferase [Flavobacteriaceae bacterium]|nr:phosphoribosylglycinamide formyltransferase [Flavobacteriaceae bacterium]
MKKTIKNIVVFASGSGSNAIKIYEYFQKNQSVNIEALFCNKKSAPVIQKFQNIGIKTIVFEKNKLQDGGVLKTLLKLNPRLIILAGFLLKMPEKIISNFENRIINIHPALLPSYGGKGMYGINIHRSVVENSELFSGLTIHYVNKDYDKGAIIFQEKVELSKNETAETLSKKILKLEHLHYPCIIEKLLKNE